MPVMACPRCGDGEIEYEVERRTDGDGPWAQSGWVGVVLYEALAGGDVDCQALRTSCGCVWQPDEQTALDGRATAAAGEYDWGWPGEP